MLRIAICRNLAVALMLMGGTVLADPPASFDLRDVGGTNYVSSVKNQIDGTCWTHGTMAAMESNLLITGNWAAAGEIGEPNLAEYHLDWWNGFNQHNNDDTDPPTGGGLTVHQGGDYRVSSAYLIRGEGAVRDVDGQSHTPAPARSDTSWHYYYARNISWFVAGSDLSNINALKNAIMDYGALGVCMCYSSSFISNNIHYQPPADDTDPNHAVAVIGWDDSKITQAPLPGAWLVKNSWGSSWGEGGYFWISYYDRHCCQHPEMGAISFQDVEPMPYDYVYYHDFHGWRDTKVDVVEAVNAFTPTDNHIMHAVSFFTAADSTDYIVRVYDSFDGNALTDLLAEVTGFEAHYGFHTIDLPASLSLTAGNDFYVYVALSVGGHPFDRTSDVPVLLGADYRVIVESAAEPGESFYFDTDHWVDLTEDDSTANFCIKACCTVEPPPLNISFPDGLPEIVAPGIETPLQVRIENGSESYQSGTATLYYRHDGGIYESSTLTPLGGGLFEALLPAAPCQATPEYYFSASGESRTLVLSPSTAPTEVYAYLVGQFDVLFEDSFDSDEGWVATYSGATNGYWQRGVPVNDPGWDYDPETAAGGSGSCYLTENVNGNTDVDNGTVLLISPTFDMSAGGDLSYDYFLYLTDAAGGVDRLALEANDNDGIGTWHEIARHDTHGGMAWYHHEVAGSEILAAGLSFTSQMKMRFKANDGDPHSIVEAAVDNFQVVSYTCTDPFLCGDADNDGEGPNIADLIYLVTFMFQDGPEPPFMASVDVNGNGVGPDIEDLIYLVSFMFQDGPDLTCP